MNRDGIDLSAVSERWECRDDGIWRDHKREVISYPADGNETYFQIEDSSFWFEHRNRIIQSLISNFRPTDTFFDIGGGNGFVAKALQNAGIPTVLVEPGERGVTNARARGVQNLVQGTWSSETIKPGSASAVGLFDVVEHIEDDVRFVADIHQTLANDGLIFITVPAFTALWSHEDTHAGHFRRYRISQLRRLLMKAGFKIEFSTYFFCLLPLPILLRRTIPSLLGFCTQSNVTKTAREHTRTAGISGRLVNQLLSLEEQRIARLKSMPTGSSCAIVARKTTRPL